MTEHVVDLYPIQPQIEADRASLKQLRDESRVGPLSALISLLKTLFQAWKTQACQFENKIKDLYTSLASKDAHTQTLNSTIQLLATEKRRLETNAAAEKVEFDCKVQTSRDCLNHIISPKLTRIELHWKNFGMSTTDHTPKCCTPKSAHWRQRNGISRKLW